MKFTLTIFGIMVFASALFYTVAQAQKTSAGFESTADFSTYKTFAFDKSGARNPLVNKMIVDAVERELTARGLFFVARPVMFCNEHPAPILLLMQK